MCTTQQFSVTVPNEMAQLIKAKVSSGEYASESEVIRDGIRALQARDAAMQNWLRREVIPAYDAIMSDPSHGLTASDVKANLAARHARTLKKRS